MFTQVDFGEASLVQEPDEAIIAQKLPHAVGHAVPPLRRIKKDVTPICKLRYESTQDAV